MHSLSQSIDSDTIFAGVLLLVVGWMVGNVCIVCERKVHFTIVQLSFAALILFLFLFLFYISNAAWILQATQ